MKKLIKYNGALGIVLLLSFASACLKDDRYIDFTKVTPTAEFLGSNPGHANAYSLDGNPKDSILVTVNITGTNAPSKDVTLTLGLASDVFALYNQDTVHVIGTLLPDSIYTFPSSVTVKAGKDALGNDNRSVTFPIIIDNTKFPKTLGINWVVPIEITSAPDGIIVSSNQNSIAFNFYHNIYDGKYNSTGTRYNFAKASDYLGWDLPTNKPKAGSVYAGTPATWNFPATLALTVNAQNTLVHEGNSDGGFGLINLKVNADNTVTISSTCPSNDGTCPLPETGVASLIPLPGPTSTYNPGTKTFDLYYQYTNPADANGVSSFRALHDTMVHD